MELWGKLVVLLVLLSFLITCYYGSITGKVYIITADGLKQALQDTISIASLRFDFNDVADYVSTLAKITALPLTITAIPLYFIYRLNAYGTVEDFQSRVPCYDVGEE